MFVQECCLGIGYFGEVLKVRSKDDGKTYVVKKVMPQYSGVSNIGSFPLEEVKMQAKLQDHPNCVKIIYVWEESDILYIQTEMWQTDLSCLAHKNHNIPERLICGYLVDMLKALEHLHNHDLPHWDISPEHIFVTDDGVCKLGDFGLAVDLEAKNLFRQKKPPTYVAQECIMQGHFSKAADVFSLGISILELATDLDLSLPANGLLWHKLREEDLEDEYFNSRETPVGPELRKILNRMMEFNPDRRPTVHQLLEDPYIKSLVAQRNREPTVQSVTPTNDVAEEENRSSTPDQDSDLRYSLYHNIHSHWGGDTNFCDDEVTEEEFNLHNNSISIPIYPNASTSRNESSNNVTVKDCEGFDSPRLPKGSLRWHNTPVGTRNRYVMQTSAESPPGTKETSSTASHSSPASPYFPCAGSGSITPNPSFGKKEQLSISLGAENISPAQSVQTPQLNLQFLKPLTFLTKKQKHENERKPRFPVAHTPIFKDPITRHRLRKSSQPMPVPFRGRTISLDSPHYNKKSSKSYFEQMFVQECCLGIGYFGEVLKVRSKDDGKTYVVKKVMPQYTGVSDIGSFPLEEVKMQAKLQDHPNCVKIIYVWEESDILYIQTEMWQTDLNCLAHKNHNILERLICGYLVDMLKALEHLHNHDLPHWDISPEHIFVTDDGVCKLGDFGLVVDLEAKNLFRQKRPPTYVAQECIMQGHFSKATDVFSLGISILELATDLDLSLPANGLLWHKLREEELEDEYFNSRQTPVGPELRKILNRMMEHNPDRRPTVHQLLEDPYIKSLVAQRNREPTVQSETPTKDESKESRSSTPDHDSDLRYSLSLYYNIHSHWGDTYFSDDEGTEEEFNLHNSIGIPIFPNVSSSNESTNNVTVKDCDGFTSPRLPKGSRRWHTTPGGSRHRSVIQTLAESPPDARKLPFPASHRSPSICTIPYAGSITPDSSFSEQEHLSDIDEHNIKQHVRRTLLFE